MVAGNDRPESFREEDFPNRGPGSRGPIPNSRIPNSGKSEQPAHQGSSLQQVAGIGGSDHLPRDLLEAFFEKALKEQPDRPTVVPVILVTPEENLYLVLYTRTDHSSGLSVNEQAIGAESSDHDSETPIVDGVDLVIKMGGKSMAFPETDGKYRWTAFDISALRSQWLVPSSLCDNDSAAATLTVSVNGQSQQLSAHIRRLSQGK